MKLRLLVTAGPTREPLDAVRFLSNASSGRLGYAVARAAARRGHKVTLVSGPVALPAPAGVRLVRITTARELARQLTLAFPLADAVVMAAAVCDYRPRRVAPRKLKKQVVGRAPVLELAANPDILASLGRRRARKRPRTRRPVLIGFALEAGSAARNLQEARRKLADKQVDRILLNTTAALGEGPAALTVVGPGAGVERWPALAKPALGTRIVRLVEELERAAR